MVTPKLLILLVLAALASPGILAQGPSPESRTQIPAAAMESAYGQKLKVPGISNAGRLNGSLYRGAQPTAAGMAQLKAMGIKTVINLRSFHSDKDEVAGTGLKSIRFEVKPWHAEKEDVIGFLKAVTDTNNLPVFVHCERGADRTGTMCAMYRIVVCGWTKPQAIEEMRQGGYHFSPVWKNLVAFIEQADTAQLQNAKFMKGSQRLDASWLKLVVCENQLSKFFQRSEFLQATAVQTASPKGKKLEIGERLQSHHSFVCDFAAVQKESSQSGEVR